jgi:hypothetical protein
MGGDRVLFDVVSRAFAGTVVDENTESYGGNRQTYRDRVFEDGDERSVLIGLPGSAVQKALPDLEARVRELNLAPVA